MTADRHKQEVDGGERFEFGENWSRFLRVLNDDRIALAERSLISMLKRDRLDGMSFVDIGSGSGLFSLAARRLGASVHSFDYDPSSCACTKELRRRYFPTDPLWTVEHGSVLDKSYLARLGQFDIVYSWGVLHHTGRMWEALDNVKPLVKHDGTLFIAIYNDLGEVTDRWAEIKKTYNRLSGPAARAYALKIIASEEASSLKGHLRNGGLGGWVRSWSEYDKTSTRGMSKWHDWIDWIGGYPYERATVEQLVDCYAKDGFRLVELVDRSHGYGCNEFVLKRVAAPGQWVDSPIPGGKSLVRRFGHKLVGISGGKGRIEGPTSTTQSYWCFEQGRLRGAVDVQPDGVTTLRDPSQSFLNGRDTFIIAGQLRQLTKPYQHSKGFMWAASLADLEHAADTVSEPSRSQIFVLEDGHQLAHPHSIHSDIAAIGQGRFSHWGTYVYFAPTDNSDPNGDAHTYAIFIPDPRP